MDRKKLLETVSMVFGVSIFIGAVWFWSLQVGDVLEILEMAYG
ncbi:MAG: hypothetical protein ACFHXK_07440 [bacterium]